jgi:hypothetical protein
MFSRTSSGIRNTPLFNNNVYIVIVEGPSDRPFWSKFFPDEFNGYKRKFKPVGGRPQVQAYINEILSHDAKFVVAMDSDYRVLLNDSYQNSRILETQYHSIENLMISPSTITSIIQNLSYNPDYEILEAEIWLEHFDLATHPLMIADIVIEANKLGKPCVGDNCSPLLINKNSPIFDAQKIQNLLENLNLPQEDFNKIAETIKHVKPQFHIRGHFLFSAALCFISHEVKKLRARSVSLSNDALYSHLISLCESRIAEDQTLNSIQQKALISVKELTDILSEHA